MVGNCKREHNFEKKSETVIVFSLLAYEYSRDLWKDFFFCATLTTGSVETMAKAVILFTLQLRQNTLVKMYVARILI